MSSTAANFTQGVNRYDNVILSALVLLVNVTCLTFSHFSYTKAVLINTTLK